MIWLCHTLTGIDWLRSIFEQVCYLCCYCSSYILRNNTRNLFNKYVCSSFRAEKKKCKVLVGKWLGTQQGFNHLWNCLISCYLLCKDKANWFCMLLRNNWWWLVFTLHLRTSVIVILSCPVSVVLLCSAKQKISELEAAKAAMKVCGVTMSCQDYYNCHFRRVCGLKTVKLLLVRSVKLNFQLPNVELVWLSSISCLHYNALRTPLKTTYIHI